MLCYEHNGGLFWLVLNSSSVSSESDSAAEIFNQLHISLRIQNNPRWALVKEWRLEQGVEPHRGKTVHDHSFR